MYDSNQADYCRITVIATGIEETPASRFGTSFARKPITPSVGQTGMKTTVSATGANTTRPYNSALQQPVHPGACSYGTAQQGTGERFKDSGFPSEKINNFSNETENTAR